MRVAYTMLVKYAKKLISSWISLRFYKPSQYLLPADVFSAMFAQYSLDGAIMMNTKQSTKAMQEKKWKSSTV